VESSSSRSSTVELNSVETPATEEYPLVVGGAALGVPLTALEVPMSAGAVAPEPSELNPLSSLLAEESSDAEVLPVDPPLDVAAGEASPPVEVETNSTSEAESVRAHRVDLSADVAQPAEEIGVGSYDLFMAELIVFVYIYFLVKCVVMSCKFFSYF